MIMRKQVKKNSNISIIETFVSDVVRDINEDVNDTVTKRYI